MASTSIWNRGFFLFLYLSASLEMTSASVLQKLRDFEEKMLEPKAHENIKAETNRRVFRTEKRQSTTGTCTCTCETKPSNGTANWTAEMSGGESQRKFSSAQEMMASGLRTDTSGRGGFGGGGYHQSPASAASDANSVPKEKSFSDQSGVNKFNDVDLTESSQGGEWGHGSRFLWKRLPDRMCYREPCNSDTDCCLWYNLCDRSAKVCVDCWYGSPCSSERDCCIRYPYCDGETRTEETPDGKSTYTVGQCVDELR